MPMCISCLCTFKPQSHLLISTSPGGRVGGEEDNGEGKEISDLRTFLVGSFVVSFL